MEIYFNWLFHNKRVFFLLLLLLTVFLRFSSLRYTFLDIDESQFAGFAHALMDGGLPYRDSVDTKPPLIYLFYTLIFGLFGKYNMTAVHAVSLLWSFQTTLVLYRIGKENDEERSGLWAALFYTFFSTTYLPKFISVSINSVMVLPLSYSVLFFLRAVKTQRPSDFFLSGIFMGLAFLFKYQAGIQLAVVLFFYFILRYGLKTSGETPPLRFIKNNFQILIGFLGPILVTLAILSQAGVGSDFLNWSLKGSLEYIEAGHQTISISKNLLFRGGGFILSTGLLWILLFRFGWNKIFLHQPYFLFLLMGFLLTLIPVCLGGRFYGHYFIHLLPVLCLIAGSEVSRVTSHLSAGRHGKRSTFYNLVSLFLIVPALFFWSLRLDFKKIDELFPDDGLFQQEKIGHWLRENTPPDASLFVWGYATAIYFHAERKVASRFLWTDVLTGRSPGSDLTNDPNFDTGHLVQSDAWDALFEDFAKHPPDYFVDTSPSNIHHYKKYPLTNYPELWQFIQNKYRFWKIIEGCPVYVMAPR